MKKQHIITIKTILFGILFCALCLIGCKKFVTVPAPQTQLVTTNVFTDPGNATAAQLSIYANLPSILAQIDRSTGLSADELFTYATDQNSKDIYANALNATTDGTGNGPGAFWTTCYKYIYQENAIIENLAGSPINVRIKQQLTGEAYFMRAYLYFYLVNMFGDAPLVTTTNYKTNTNMAKTMQKQIYQQIIADLTTAHSLLSSKYVDATDTIITTDRVRPTTWAANALLARVYLYYGNLTGDASNYAKAIAEVDTVIGNSSEFSLSPLSGVGSVFLKNSSEAILQFMPASTTGNTAEGSFFVLIQTPTTFINASSTMSTSLLNTFEPGDKRKVNWVGSYMNGTNTYYFPYKYKLTTTASAPAGEYSMILRLGEQYLIRAEAEADNNDPGDATNDLNIIRARAGLAPYSAAVNGTLAMAIAHERQVELFTEGQRWFDLKRTGQVNAVMTVVTPAKSGNAWQSYQQLYPIPLADVQTDLNLAQNNGY